MLATTRVTRRIFPLPWVGSVAERRSRFRDFPGLGLYLVAGVARMFGGEIVYRDDLPDVCFGFWLPTSDPPDAGPPDADLPDADLPGAGPPRL